MYKKYHRIVSKRPSRLTEEDLVNVQRIALDYLKTHEFVTNRILRKIAGVEYDQAIHFYNEMLKRKVIKKIGIASATRYILSRKKSKSGGDCLIVL